MITSYVLQAAEATINSLRELFPTESDVDSAMAKLAIGPRALAEFVRKHTNSDEDRDAVILRSFLIGVAAARLSDAIDSGEITVNDLGDYEPMYEGAYAGDLQDLLFVDFGIETDDEIDINELVDLTLQTFLGVSLSELEGDEPSDGEAATDPIDPDLAAE